MREWNRQYSNTLYYAQPLVFGPSPIFPYKITFTIMFNIHLPYYFSQLITRSVTCRRQITFLSPKLLLLQAFSPPPFWKYPLVSLHTQGLLLSRRRLTFLSMWRVFANIIPLYRRGQKYFDAVFNAPYTWVGKLTLYSHGLIYKNKKLVLLSNALYTELSKP